MYLGQLIYNKSTWVARSRNQRRAAGLGRRKRVRQRLGRMLSYYHRGRSLTKSYSFFWTIRPLTRYAIGVQLIHGIHRIPHF